MFDTNVLLNIAQYDRQGRLALSEHMQIDESDEQSADTQIDTLIQSYEALLKSQKEALAQLQHRTVPLTTVTTPSASPRTRLQQLRVIERAYTSLTASQPDLPDPQSAVGMLLAAKELNESLQNSRAALDSTIDIVDSTEKHAVAEESSLADAILLSGTLSQRDQSLHRQQREQAKLAPERSAQNMLSKKTQRQKQYERSSEALYDALVSFVNDHLAAFIAAEELGGPVTGDLQDVSDDMLTAGFSSSGKPKSNMSKAGTDEQRQKRIDEIWGSALAVDQPISEHDMAASETINLINNLLESSKANPGSYLDLARDSAASRFLVRAKVAQYHPKDARKLRLLDFGRELAD